MRFTSKARDSSAAGSHARENLTKPSRSASELARVLGAAALVAILLCSGGLRSAANGEKLPPIDLPGGKGGIGFDDLGFSRSLHRVLIPAGCTGALDLLDPGTRLVVGIRGFAMGNGLCGCHGGGITSVDEDRGFLFVTDRTSRRLVVIDPKTLSVVSSAPLSSSPDYVRFVGESGEVWVTEPSAERIEVFSLGMTGRLTPVSQGFIAVPGGPESLIVDHTRARVFTHLWRGATVAISIKDRSLMRQWRNGCRASRGIALDERRGFLFAGCAEGRLMVLDANRGEILGRASSGRGVDIIAYNARLSHAYLPGAESATMAIIRISARGSTTLAKTIKTAKGAHCVTVDDHNRVYVCDPANGRLLLFQDGPNE